MRELFEFLKSYGLEESKSDMSLFKMLDKNRELLHVLFVHMRRRGWKPCSWRSLRRRRRSRRLRSRSSLRLRGSSPRRRRRWRACGRSRQEGQPVARLSSTRNRKLQYNRKLKRLFLYGNLISDDGKKALIDAGNAWWMKWGTRRTALEAKPLSAPKGKAVGLL